MAGGLVPRLKSWVTREVLRRVDLNNEINNILDNLTCLGILHFSQNAAQMKQKKDPGTTGSENLAADLSEELKGIRYVLDRIQGGENWYDPAPSGLNLDTLSQESIGNRIISGAVKATNYNQPVFLSPNDPNDEKITLSADTTPFKIAIDNVEYEFTEDIESNNLTPAPSSNNYVKADLTGTIYNGHESSRILGEEGTVLPIKDHASTGTAIEIGKTHALSVYNGTTTEYFIGFVKSATEIVDAKRGYWFDEAGNGSDKIVLSHDNVITLLKMTWMFLKSDGTLLPTYTEPIYAGTPPSADDGTYCYDTIEKKWKVRQSGAWVDAEAHLIGACAQDATNVIVARSYYFHATYDKINTIKRFNHSSATVRAGETNATISVMGKLLRWKGSAPEWDITKHLSGGGEAAATNYFLYITDEQNMKISALSPHDRRQDMFGWYHPHYPWRCVGEIYNNADSNFEAVIDPEFYSSEKTRFEVPGESIEFNGPVENFPPGFIRANGIPQQRVKYPRLFRAVELTWGIYLEDEATFRVPDHLGLTTRMVDSGSEDRDPDRTTRTMLPDRTSGNEGVAVGSYQADQIKAHEHKYGPTTWAVDNLTLEGPGEFRIKPSEPWPDVDRDTEGGGDKAQTTMRNVYVEKAVKV